MVGNTAPVCRTVCAGVGKRFHTLLYQQTLGHTVLWVVAEECRQQIHTLNKISDLILVCLFLCSFACLLDQPWF